MCLPGLLFQFVFTFQIESFQLWEIVTLGDSPYRGLPFEDLCEWLRSGRRMERPRACPEALFEVRKESDLCGVPHICTCVSNFTGDVCVLEVLAGRPARLAAPGGLDPRPLRRYVKSSM